MKNSNSDLYQWVLLQLRERLNEADEIFNRMNETVLPGTVVMDLPDDEQKKIQELTRFYHDVVRSTGCKALLTNWDLYMRMIDAPGRELLEVSTLHTYHGHAGLPLPAKSVPGYPACDLSQQQPLFALLQPERIGVRLTESMMMDPEFTVSAVIPLSSDARYW